MTRADAQHYARLPPGGVQGLAGVFTRPAGCPTRGAPPAAARQLHLLTYVGARPFSGRNPRLSHANNTRYLLSSCLFA